LDEPLDPRFVVVDEPVVERVVVAERFVIRLDEPTVSRERTLAFTWPPLERVLNVVRLDSPRIATLGCRFLMMSDRRSGSDTPTRIRFFLLITVVEGSSLTPTTWWRTRLPLMKTSLPPRSLTPTRVCVRL